MCLGLAQPIRETSVLGRSPRAWRAAGACGACSMNVCSAAAARGPLPCSSAASVIASTHANAGSTRPLAMQRRRRAGRCRIRDRARAPARAPSRLAHPLPCRPRTRASQAPAANRRRRPRCRSSDTRAPASADRAPGTRVRAGRAARRRTDRSPRLRPAAGAPRSASSLSRAACAASLSSSTARKPSPSCCAACAAAIFDSTSASGSDPSRRMHSAAARGSPARLRAASRPASGYCFASTNFPCRSPISASCIRMCSSIGLELQRLLVERRRLREEPFGELVIGDADELLDRLRRSCRRAVEVAERVDRVPVAAG